MKCRLLRVPGIGGRLCLVMLFLLTGASMGLAQSASPASEVELDELNRKLARYLTQTRWEGQFAIAGKEPLLKPERYEIIQAEKADEGDLWNLVARIKYGDKDITLPLPPIEIKWAGQTPIITVDQVTLPGMGTFDARVVIRSGQYAGVWKHGKVAGHMFGKIEKIKDGE